MKVVLVITKRTKFIFNLHHNNWTSIVVQ
uniref:Uncharacterized protein n=1 Tax=Arundo donax TaxID=35708 RepID=A0A0A9FI12_ARUDO